MKIKNIKEWMAENIFNEELDQAYHDGLREGADFATYKVSMALQRDLELTKTQKLGYDIAMERFELTKELVRDRLGILK